MKLPQHLFLASDGTLYDTRKKDWSNSALREKYSYTFRDIETTSQLRACLRAGQYTDYGGYPLYFITSDGAALSFESVRRELKSVLWSIKNNCNDGWKVIGCEINYEDPDLYCDHSNKRIKSAYAD